MVNELESIPNPTFREQVERAIEKPIIAGKAKFGLRSEEKFLSLQKIASNKRKR